MQKRLSIPINKSLQTILQMLAVFYLMVWSVAPPLQMDLIFRLIALGLAFVWFVIEFLRRFEFTMLQIWCALFMVAVAIIAYLQNGASSVISEIAVYMMVLAYFINIYSSDSWQNYKIIVPVTLILLIVFNIRTNTALNADASIARQLVRNTEELYDFMRSGVGGYGLVYPQVCIAPVVYGWMLKSLENHKINFVIGLAWSVSFWAVLSKAGYSIAIIAASVSLIVFVFYRRRNILPALLISVAVIIVTILMLLYVDGFRNFILNIFEGTKVVRKIEDLLSTAEGETADSFATRIERYWQSILSCFQFPIIGGKIFGAKTGGHSEILDVFADYGVWGGVPTVMMIFHTPVYFKKISYTPTVYATANAHFLAIALVALFDPFVFQVYFPLLILCPVMYSDIMKWTGELYENSMDR